MLSNSIKIILLISCLLIIPPATYAIDITALPNVSIKKDILLRPAKIEFTADQGTTSVKFIDVLNRTGGDREFSVEADDFSFENDKNSVDIGKTVSGLNTSLKKYMIVPSEKFVLTHGEQARIPVAITVPENTPPGGLYGVVLVSGRALSGADSATSVVTRVGALFFVKVGGDWKSSGSIKSFVFKDNKLNIEFENDGNVYLNPYGIINVYEYYTRKLVKQLEVDPWFVLPQSTRVRSIIVGGLPSGKYAAEMSLNRGYDNLVDNKYVNFDVSGSERDSSLMTVIVLVLVGVIILTILIFYVRF